ncbi:hypothetical protein [Bailinhaonella thermotolerans]|uniref:Lipoprotein n=1 Tax=Bailinhaonella thermotolerans TaxID=1070861 RepID=A0A3A4ABN4_9ACTN|nr:hypothetical protein [Bailinhaonella thermotolerans]RJL24217.1 hypothetical protein D5H75_30730 [Bailinhaonella thermotolerans]
MRGRLRGVAGLTCLAVIGAGSAGCATDEQNLGQSQPRNEGANATAGGMRVVDAFILAGPPDQRVQAGASLPLYLNLLSDRGPDRLVSVSAPGFARGAQVNRRFAEVAPGRPQTDKVPAATLEGLTRAVPAYGHVPVTVTFERAGQVKLNVPIKARSGEWASYPPVQLSPTPTAQPRPEPSRVRPGSSPGPGSTATPAPGSTGRPRTTPTAQRRERDRQTPAAPAVPRVPANARQ